MKKASKKAAKKRIVIRDENGKEWVPKTELGRAVLKLQKTAVKEGWPVKSADQILDELARFRAGRDL